MAALYPIPVRLNISLGAAHAALALLAAGFLCYREQWPWLAGALAARAFVISFLDNIYHYRTPVSDVLYADNLWLPPWLSMPLLHFNLHGVHHRNTVVPWASLPSVFARESAAYQAHFFAAAARQLSGPIPLSELLMSSKVSSRKTTDGRVL
jgi:fatty acid desaturase